MFSKCCSREAYIYGEYLNMTFKKLTLIWWGFFSKQTMIIIIPKKENAFEK